MKNIFERLGITKKGAENPTHPLTEEAARTVRLNQEAADFESGKYDSVLPEADVEGVMRDLEKGGQNGPSEDKLS